MPKYSWLSITMVTIRSCRWKEDVTWIEHIFGLYSRKNSARHPIKTSKNTRKYPMTSRQVNEKKYVFLSKSHACSVFKPNSKTRHEWQSYSKSHCFKRPIISFNDLGPIKRKTLTLTLHKFIFLIKSMYPHVFYSH